VIPPAEESVRCKEELFALANNHIEQLVPVTADVCIGKPAAEICDIARRSEADIIVIATHGHTGLARTLLGSTAEAVIRHAPCPVLVAREREHEFV
jgi:nucleotide-binding universal stress UspA family protein